MRQGVLAGRFGSHAREGKDEEVGMVCLFL